MKNHYEINQAGDVAIEVWCVNQKLHAFVDQRDLPLVYSLPVRWYASPARAPRDKYYVFAKLRTIKPVKTISMHRVIMGDPQGMDVHHVDNDGLNNRLSNLEVITHRENIRARRPDHDYWEEYDRTEAIESERIAVFKKLVEIGKDIATDGDLTRQQMFRIRNHMLTSKSAKAYWMRVAREMPDLFKSDAEREQPWITGPERTSAYYERKPRA